MRSLLHPREILLPLLPFTSSGRTPNQPAPRWTNCALHHHPYLVIVSVLYSVLQTRIPIADSAIHPRQHHQNRSPLISSSPHVHHPRLPPLPKHPRALLTLSRPHHEREREHALSDASRPIPIPKTTSSPSPPRQTRPSSSTCSAAPQRASTRTRAGE